MVAPYGERSHPYEILNIQRGASVFIYAAALSLILSPGKLTPEAIDTTFSKLIPAMNRTYLFTQKLAQTFHFGMPSMPRSLGVGEIVGRSKMVAWT